MNNIIAAWLAAIIIVFVLGDYIIGDGGAVFFLAKETLKLIEWVAFWR